MHFGKKKENKETDETKKRRKVIGELRRTQMITTSGSGAIVDMPDFSAIIAGTDYWRGDSPVLHEPNLEKLLGVKCFKEPYVSDNKDNIVNPDIPAFRFPYYHFCPKCGNLMHYRNFGDAENHFCTNKHAKSAIVPSRFIAACVNGHLEDFPYDWWVHNGKFSDCGAKNRNDILKIEFSDESGGLDSIIITCKACGKSRSMAGCMSKDALKGYSCKGKRPWFGSRKEQYDEKKCEAPMRTLQRGASNVYYSLTVSALTIPPWSSDLQNIIAKKWDTVSPILKAEDFESQKKILSYIFHEELQEGRYTLEDILTAINKRLGNIEIENYTKQNLLEDEYNVFCSGEYDEFQFKTSKSQVPDILKKYLDDIVLVKRLREVLALRGFRRISPEPPVEGSETFKGYNLKGDHVPLSKQPLGWLPGVELLGEGIFIKVNEKALGEWESAYGDEYSDMGKRLVNSNVVCDNFSARYVLLHTLSHLLIRQLSLECGYSGASLKERIYSTYSGSKQKMSGILIYTSSSDSDGSLGGLVRNGYTYVFENIFRNMLQEASWCSSDPICINSHAQGYDALNYAACHACTLLPETSCEMRNCLLDRAAIVGSFNNRDKGMFRDILE